MVEVQRLAAAAVGKVLAGRSLDATLTAALLKKAGLGEQERAALRDLSYGTLRHLGRLQAFLDELLERPLRDARLRPLLLVALYQLCHTRAAHYAVVDSAVRCAARIGFSSAKALVNGVLRNFLRSRAVLEARADRSEAGRYSHPQWWIDRLRAQYPEHSSSILESGNTHPPLTLRVNRRRATPEQALRLLASRGVAGRLVGEVAIQLHSALPARAIPGLAEGIVSVQDAGAQLAAPALDLAAGQRVLDACAAPGGKAAHILELADVELTALDIDATRLARVRENLDRLGLDARLVQGDATRPEAWWEGVSFDRILADVPCTASGIARRHPDVKWLRRAEDLPQYAAAQERMLDALWRLLDRGGKLLYATCSVFHEENHLQVARFLERHEDARRLDLAATDEDPLLPAGQLLPDRVHDGFFYALLHKT